MIGSSSLNKFGNTRPKTEGTEQFERKDFFIEISQPSLPHPEDVVNKLVELRCHANRRFRGYVYTIDPSSGNYVLLRHSQTDGVNGQFVERVRPIVVSRWAIEGVDILSSNQEPPDPIQRFIASCLEPNQQSDDHSLHCDEHVLLQATDSSLDDRKTSLIGLFATNGIELKSNGAAGDLLTFEDILTIKPPYTCESCQSPNINVLNKARKLIASLST